MNFLSTTLAVVTSVLAPFARQQVAPSFEQGLAGVQRAIEKRRWDEARATLLELLARHEGDPAVLQHLATVREDLMRCAFWSGRAAPDPKALISGELLTRAATSGKLKVRYAPDRLEDFDRHPNAVRLHPLTFDGDYSVEIEWKKPRTLEDEDERPLVAVGLDSDAAVGVFLGEHAVIAEKTAISWWHVREVPFASKVKLIRKQDAVEILVDGKKVETREFAPTGYGRILLARGDDLPPTARLTIEGNGQASWLQRVVDDAVRRDWEKFEQRYAIEKDLPEWILRAESPPAARVAFTYPGPRTEAQDALWSEGMTALASSSSEKLETFLAKKVGPDCTQPFRDYWNAQLQLASGAADEALASALRVLDADPDNVAARLLHIDALEASGDRETALSAVRDLVFDEPTLPDASSRLARMLLWAGRVDEARETVQRALEAGTPVASLGAIQSMLGKIARGPEWSRVHQHESAHYRVRTDIDPATCREASRHLELALRAYARDLGKPSGDDRLYEVVIFSGEGGYKAYCSDLLGDEPHNTLGLYHNLIEQLLIWNVPDRAEMMRVVRHEGFHQYLDRLLADVEQAPRWLNEGLATYYETLDPLAGELERGGLHAESMEVLHYLALPDLDEFLLLPAERFYRPENYCFSWLLVHYLLHSDERERAVFDDLLARLMAGEKRVEAVRGAFAGYGGGELQKAVGLHLRRLRSQPR